MDKISSDKQNINMNLYVSTGPISPVERFEITKKIWMLNEVTREEAEQILHNKEPGNFLVRGSKLDEHILVLSVKLGSRHGVLWNISLLLSTVVVYC